jgi:WD40 repeat protein
VRIPDEDELVTDLREALEEGAEWSADEFVDHACRDQHARWRRGQRVPVEYYLALRPSLADEPEAVLDLLYAEFVLREEEGETPALEEYQFRFPKLAQTISEQWAIHRALLDVAVRDELVSEIPTGPQVDGYEVLEELGRGGMGVVFKARQLGLNRLVALKMLPAVSSSSEPDLLRLRNEAEAISRLKHPHIVQIYEFGWSSEQPFLALELLEGGTLAQHLKVRPWPPRAAAELIATLAQAVHAAHCCGIVHRDLKPGNILFERSLASLPSVDETPSRISFLPMVPKITDFGLAKLDHASGLTVTGDVIGTPAYMAPEQVAGLQDVVGPAADIYALGAMLYELLAGRPPFQATTALGTLMLAGEGEPMPPSRWRPGLPRDLETLCMKCLEKLPGKRYASADALAQDLGRYLRGEPIEARPAGGIERFWKAVRRRPAISTLIALVVLVALAGFAGVCWQWSEAVGARQKAISLAKEETAQRQRAEFHLYRSRVAQAGLLWEADDVARARALLAECVPQPDQDDQREWEWYYLTHACQPARHVWRQHFWVNGLATSPDGRYLAVALGMPDYESSRTAPGVARGELAVWDLREEKLAWNQPNTESALQALAYSPDGKDIAVSRADGTVEIWDSAARSVRKNWRAPGLVVGLAYRPDGKELATATTEGTFVWATGDFHQILLLRDLAAPSVGVAYSPDSSRLVMARKDRRIVSRNANNGDVQFSLDCPDLDLPSSVAFSPDGKYLLIGTWSGLAHLWDSATGQPVQRLIGHRGVVQTVAFSPDGQHALTGSADRTIRVWSVETGKTRSLLRSHTAGVRAVAPSADGLSLCSGGQDRVLLQWDLTRDPRGQLFSFSNRTNAAAFSADGRFLRAAHLGGGVGSWEVGTGIPLPEQRVAMTTDQPYPARYAAFFPDQARLLSVRREALNELAIWDAATGALLFELHGHQGPVTAVAVGADGKSAVSSAKTKDGNEVICWDARTGRQTIRFTLPGPGVICVLAISPDGRSLAAGLNAHGNRTTDNLQMVDLPGGTVLFAAALSHDFISALAFDPAGRRLAIAALDGTVEVHDAATGKPIHQLLGPPSLTDVTFSPPNGRRLAAVGYDSSVVLWDGETGSEILTLPGLTGRRPDDFAFDARVAFSPDGQWLLSTNWNDTINLWDGRRQPPEDRAPLTDRDRFTRHAEEALAAVRSGAGFAARFHLERLDALTPSDDQQRGQRGQIRAALGRWADAIGDLRPAIEARKERAPPEQWFALAGCLLMSGDHEGYRRLGRSWRPDAELGKREWLVSFATLTPEPPVDVREVCTWAERAVALSPPQRRRIFLALAYYRAGRIDDSERELATIFARDPKGMMRVPGLLLQSLDAIARGNREVAERVFAQAKYWMSTRPDDQAAMQPDGMAWEEWLMCQLLLREAEERLKAEP